MNRTAHSIRLAFAALVLTLLPGGLLAQSIQGSITTATDGSPVPGASVILLDGAGVNVVGTATSDGAGAYSVETPGAGTYLLVVERAGFANQVSSPITVGAEDVRYSLTMTEQRVGQSGAVADGLDDATLLSQALAEICQDRFVPGMHAIVYGAVRNQADSDPLPYVQVQAQWSVEGMGTDKREVRSDEAGAYLICDVPAGVRVTLRAQEPETDVQGDAQALTLRAGTMRKVDVGIPLSDPNQGGNLIGQVTDERSRPLSGARVLLVGEDRTTTTNDRGVFVFSDVTPGTEVIEAEMMGYALQREAVRVLGGRAQQLTVRLAVDPVDLAPIVVSVRPRKWFFDRQALEHRILLGTGYFILREDLEERAAQVLGEALRGIPGVQVTKLGGGIAGTYDIRMRGAANLANQTCNPVVWLDGVRIGNDPAIFRDIQAFEIELIEVYRGPAEVPGAFSGGEARCGVVAVWTRRGGRLG